jgi:hypothetical protein
MRLKLVVIASLIAAIVGAAGGIGIIYWILGLWRSNFVWTASYFGAGGALLLPPILLAMSASFFVYRHTARRRKLQAALTAILTIAISLAAYTAVFLLLFR